MKDKSKLKWISLTEKSQVTEEQCNSPWWSWLTQSRYNKIITNFFSVYFQRSYTTHPIEIKIKFQMDLFDLKAAIDRGAIRQPAVAFHLLVNASMQVNNPCFSCILPT